MIVDPEVVAHQGLAPSLLAACKPPSATSAMTKTKVTKYLMWCEKAIRERKHRDRGSSVSQIEKLYVVLPDEQTFTYHSRTHYAGSNRGDTIGPIKAPSWEDSWVQLSTNYVFYIWIPVWTIQLGTHFFKKMGCHSHILILFTYGRSKLNA